MAEDIVVTWPKGRPLSSYLAVLTAAVGRGDEISYRVGQLPSGTPERCYRVHTGRVRGWTPILRCEARGAHEVRRVDGHGYWAAGFYIVCSPEWHPVELDIPMRGFQGWRWATPIRLAIEAAEPSCYVCGAKPPNVGRLTKTSWGHYFCPAHPHPEAR